jgi:hypothetical protein
MRRWKNSERIEFENGGQKDIRRKGRPEKGYSSMKTYIHSYCC